MWSPWVGAHRATRRATPRRPRRRRKGILRKFYDEDVGEDTGLFLFGDFPIPREVGEMITWLRIFVAMLEGLTGTCPQRIPLFHEMPCLYGYILCTVVAMLFYLPGRRPPEVSAKPKPVDGSAALPRRRETDEPAAPTSQRLPYP
jgi:hypothetical protein